MKLKVLIALILILSLGIMPVSAVNFSTYYFDEAWYQNLVALLVEFPSLLDENYVEEVRSRGEYPVDAIYDESENGEIVYYIPYKCCFFNPGDEYNDVLEPYILYVHEKFTNMDGDIADADDCVFFMAYKFNETSGKYEFNERIPVSPQVYLSKESNYTNMYSVEMQYNNFVVGDEFIEYAQDIYNSKKQTTSAPETIEVAPDTGDIVIIIFMPVIVLSGIVFASTKYVNKRSFLHI